VQDKVKLLPTPKPKKKIPIKQIYFMVLRDTEGQLLLEKRPDMGIWGGLWSFPEFDTYTAVESWCLQKNMPIHSVSRLDEQRHTFSHYHLDYTAIIIKTEILKNIVLEVNQSVWYKVGQNNALGLPAPIQKLLTNQGVN
jgi:A/G-specific adenine glycosylase